MALDRRKRPLVREPGDWRDASLFIIATEGEKTEPLYFELFSSPRVKVKSLPCEDGRSSPEAVLNRIDEFKSNYHFGSEDTFWLVIDRDRWPVKTLAAVKAQCRQKSFMLLVSNPRFEVWLAYHSEDPLPAKLGKRELERHLKSVLGTYKKGDYNREGLLQRSAGAVARARASDVGTNAIWPDPPGSRVYLLVEELLKRV